MEQREDDAAKDPSGTVDEEGPSEEPKGDGTIVERRFGLLLFATLLIAAGAGTAVTYLQYDRVGETLSSIPYTDQVGQVATQVPYAGQVVAALPQVDGPETSPNEPREYGSFAEIEQLVVNPAGSEGERYLAVSLALETTSASVETELEEKRVVVQDAVLNLLSKQTVDELSDPTNRGELKKALRREVNGILGPESVKQIYFTEFVLQ